MADPTHGAATDQPSTKHHMVVIDDPWKRVNMAACAWAEIILPPPVGHRGKYYTVDPPGFKVGDLLEFVIYCDVPKGYGRVTGIHQVNDMGDKWYGWYCTTWEDWHPMSMIPGRVHTQDAGGQLSGPTNLEPIQLKEQTDGNRTGHTTGETAGGQLGPVQQDGH